MFESHETDKEHGRLSLLGVDPSLEIKGTNNDASVKLINPRGEAYFNFIKNRFKAYVKEESGDTLYLHISKIPFTGKESDRFKDRTSLRLSNKRLSSLNAKRKISLVFMVL